MQQNNVEEVKKPRSGHVFFEVVGGVEGPCLVLGDNCSGLRIAGPKPWGGGEVRHRFQVNVAETIAELQKYLPSGEYNRVRGPRG